MWTTDAKAENENIQNNRVGWAGDYDSFEFCRIACVEKDIGGVLLKQMVVGLVSLIHCLARVYYNRLRKLLWAKVR